MSDFCIRVHFEIVALHDVDDVQWCEVQPAPAAFGVLCRKCYGRTNYLIGQFPQLLAHIRSQVAPSMQSARGERVGGTRELPLPLNAKASEDSHDLYRVVANWATYYARKLDFMPPASLWEPFVRDADVKYLPGWAEQVAAFGLGYDLEGWFKSARDTMIWQPSIGEFHDDIVTTVQPLIRRYPQFEQKRSHKHLCEECGYVEVEARWVGDGWRDVVIDCNNCGYRVPASEIDSHLDWSGW